MRGMEHKHVAEVAAEQLVLSEYDKSAVVSAGAVFKQISIVQQRQFSDEAPPDKVLYHYTSAEGLKGIIEKNALWATSAYYLNDSAEMFYGYNVLREVLDQWLNGNTRTENSITLGLARQLRSSFDDLFEKRLLKPIYLTCFCCNTAALIRNAVLTAWVFLLSPMKTPITRSPSYAVITPSSSLMIFAAQIRKVL
jgi:hypothetical protein